MQEEGLDYLVLWDTELLARTQKRNASCQAALLATHGRLALELKREMQALRNISIQRGSRSLGI